MNQPCFVYGGEIQNSLHNPHTTVSAAGFTGTDAVYRGGEEGSAPRVIFIDEFLPESLGHIRNITAADLTEAMNEQQRLRMDLTLEEVDLESPKSARRAAKSEKFAEYREQRTSRIDNELDTVEAWKPKIFLLRGYIEQVQADDGHPRPLPPEIVEAIRETAAKYPIPATAEWEKPVWERLQKMTRLVLWTLHEIVRAALEGSAVVSREGLTILYERPLLDIIIAGRNPLCIDDATPHPTISGLVELRGGETQQVVARQHVQVHIDPRYLNSMPRKDLQSDERDRASMRELLDLQARVKAEGRGREVATIVNKARMTGLIAEKTGMSMPEIRQAAANGDQYPDEIMDRIPEHTWWGQHRAHNRYAGYNLIKHDSPAFPRVAQQNAWWMHRAILIRAGADPESLPIGSFDDTDYTANRWERAGRGDQRHKGRTHRDDVIYRFIQTIMENEEIQFIVRSRAVNAAPDDPIHIYVTGGIANGALRRAGIEDHQIHHEMLLPRKSRSELRAAEKQKSEARAWAASKAIATRGGIITRNTLNDELVARGEAKIGGAVYRRLQANPEYRLKFLDNFSKLGRSARTNAALDSLEHTVQTAGWQADKAEAAIKDVNENFARYGGDARQIIDHYHAIMKPGYANETTNAAGWLALGVLADTEQDWRPPACSRRRHPRPPKHPLQRPSITLPRTTAGNLRPQAGIAPKNRQNPRENEPGNGKGRPGWRGSGRVRRGSGRES